MKAVTQNNSNKSLNKKFNLKIKQCLLVVTLICSGQLLANTTDIPSTEKNIKQLQGVKKQNIAENKKALLHSAVTKSIKKITREEYLAKKNTNNKKSKQVTNNSNASSTLSSTNSGATINNTMTNNIASSLLAHNNFSSTYSFDIYQANTVLIHDYDQDGYYSSFSLSFDADLLSDRVYDEALVYAEIYISENGGPWMHFSTTNDFIIYNDSSDDEYEIISTLEQNYASEHYDFLIDLYEVGYDDLVASYSADDDNVLYALPLESQDYDPDYDEVQTHTEVHHYGGSTSVLSLFSLIALLVLRRNLKNLR